MTHDLKEGDRIEITVRGKVSLARGVGWVHVTLDGCNAPSVFTSGELAQAQITKLEHELKVGRAMLKKSGSKGRVLAIHEHRAWFQYDSSGDYCTYSASDLHNIPEDGQ